MYSNVTIGVQIWELRLFFSRGALEAREANRGTRGGCLSGLSLCLGGPSLSPTCVLSSAFLQSRQGSQEEQGGEREENFEYRGYLFVARRSGNPWPKSGVISWADLLGKSKFTAGYSRSIKVREKTGCQMDPPPWSLVNNSGWSKYMLPGIPLGWSRASSAGQL